jgi:hypothetical protein
LRNRIFFLLAFCGLVASAPATAQSLSFLDGYNYSVGGGVGIGRTYVSAFAGNSPFGVATFGKTFSRLFGADAEYMYYDLGLRPSVEFNQGVPDSSAHMQSFSLDGVVHVPYHFKKFSAYGIFGVGFYDRAASVPRTYLHTGTICQPVLIRWWDVNCNYTNNPPTVVAPGQYISSNSKVAGGFNFGGAISHPLNHLHDADWFVEWRYHRAYMSDAESIVMPITIGLRWGH